jgi:hypothetical protein
MIATADRHLWWLTVYDPQTGIATRIVAVVGAEGTARHLSWMPLDSAAAPWAQALNDSTPDLDHMMAVLVDTATTVADGIVLGFIEVDNPPPATDLAGAVEAAIDQALTAAIEDDRTH